MPTASTTRASSGSTSRASTGRTGNGTLPRSAERQATLSDRDREGVRRELLAWYSGSARDLPWRKKPEPYAVWVSEVMLQQTQVETVKGYFSRWMQRFPSVKALAAATESDVLHVWQGLGY